MKKRTNTHLQKYLFLYCSGHSYSFLPISYEFQVTKRITNWLLSHKFQGAKV